MAASAASESPPGFISQRAARALQPALSYGKAFVDAQARPWSAEDPGGNIICSVAENKLTADMVHERISEAAGRAPVSTLYYPKGFRGTEEARTAVARMCTRTFMKGIDVNPGDLVMLAGAGAVLDTLFWSICGPGEGVLLPKPIYPAFLNDLEVRDSCVPVLFDLKEPGVKLWSRGHEEEEAAAVPPIPDQLDAAAAAAAARGVTVRVLLLAQPNNPTGTVYKRETIEAAIRWCMKHRIHLVSDEIYALSVWGEGAPEFVSTEVVARALALDLPRDQAEAVPQLVHTVFGFSKDWCASGLRVGVLHTRNATLLAVMDNYCYFHTASAHTLWALTQVLSDDAFVDAFVAENQRRMRNAYAGLSGALDAAGIPHVRACAAMFAFLDLRAGLKEDSWEGEDELWRALCAAGVLLSPGSACKADKPGYFRCCWAWVPPEALPMAVSRISALLDSRRKAE
uniref:Aminotransferase class I/classII large domain-containing protein n=1 Tax=Chlamydomonas leiostraca TaxID=1034604 RepID=A0A7S0RJE5_9CHLO|mmetsp:Transcript_23685/g.60482  ORF Transcript_23685/g.60482 Transcript_23685/m.60482 type:complete len:456 (+) Transcript_23685:83-1450(+)